MTYQQLDAKEANNFETKQRNGEIKTEKANG